MSNAYLHRNILNNIRIKSFIDEVLRNRERESILTIVMAEKHSIISAKVHKETLTYFLTKGNVLYDVINPFIMSWKFFEINNGGN